MAPRCPNASYASPSTRATPSVVRSSQSSASPLFVSFHLSRISAGKQKTGRRAMVGRSPHTLDPDRRRPTGASGHSAHLLAPSTEATAPIHKPDRGLCRERCSMVECFARSDGTRAARRDRRRERSVACSRHLNKRVGNATDWDRLGWGMRVSPGRSFDTTRRAPR